MSHLEILLNPSSSQEEVLGAVEQLLLNGVIYKELENYDSALLPVYYRLLNANFNVLLNLISEDENIMGAFKVSDYTALNSAFYNIEPVISISYKSPKVDTDIIKKIIEYGNIIDSKIYDDDICTLKRKPGLPVPYNNRRHKLSVYFNIPYNRVHVKMFNYEYSSLLEEFFINLVIKETLDEQIFLSVSNVVATQTLSDYLNKFLYLISQNSELVDVMKVIVATNRYLKNREQNVSELNNFRSKINEAILKNENIDNVLSENVKDLMYIPVESSLIDWNYVINQLMPKLKLGKEFDVTTDIDRNFLLAFPYYDGKRYYVENDKVLSKTEFDVSKLPNLANECIDRFQHVKNLINTNYSYETISDVVKLHKFTIQEGLGFVKFVVNFEGFLCTFVASLICYHVLKLFGVTDFQLRLMYSIIKQIPPEILENEKMAMCRYKNLNNPINLNVLYHNCNKLNILKDKNVEYVIQNLLKSSKNKSELYGYCHPYNISPWNLFKYITPDASPLMTSILCRLLLNVPNLSKAEKNLLKIISDEQVIQFNVDVDNVEFFNKHLRVDFDEQLDLRVDWNFVMKDLIYCPMVVDKSVFENYLESDTQ
jgi:hypothetical protein